MPTKKEQKVVDNWEKAKEEGVSFSDYIKKCIKDGLLKVEKPKKKKLPKIKINKPTIKEKEK